MSTSSTRNRPVRAAFIASLVLSACAPPKPSFDRAFVSEAATASIAVIDLDRGVVEQRIDVGHLPHNLVLSPDAKTLYVAITGSQAVGVIDTATATLTQTWLTAPVPATRRDGTLIQEHITENAFAHTTCYDCHKDGGAKPRYVGDRPVALRLDGTRLYVGHIESGEVAVLDTTSGARVAASVLAPIDTVKEVTAIDLLDGELFVSMRPTQPSRVSGVVRRLDAITLEARGDIAASPNPVEVLTSRDRVLVTHFDSDQLSLLTAAGEERSITVANGPLGLTRLSGDRALVLGYYSNAVSLVDLTRGDVDTWPLTLDGRPLVNPTHAALGSDPNTAWIVQSGTDSRLVALDLQSRSVTRTIPIHGLSYDVAIVKNISSTLSMKESSNALRSPLRSASLCPFHAPGVQERR